MIDLDAVRKRSELAINAVVADHRQSARDQLTIEQVVSRWYSSAKDVPDLLTEIEYLQARVVEMEEGSP